MSDFSEIFGSVRDTDRRASKPARRRCPYSYESLVGPEARTAQRGDAVACPRCGRALKATRRWGDGAVARYPAHYPPKPAGAGQ